MNEITRRAAMSWAAMMGLPSLLWGKKAQAEPKRAGFKGYVSQYPTADPGYRNQYKADKTGPPWLEDRMRLNINTWRWDQACTMRIRTHAENVYGPMFPFSPIKMRCSGGIFLTDVRMRQYADTDEKNPDWVSNPSFGGSVHITHMDGTSAMIERVLKSNDWKSTTALDFLIEHPDGSGALLSSVGIPSVSATILGGVDTKYEIGAFGFSASFKSMRLIDLSKPKTYNVTIAENMTYNEEAAKRIKIIR